MAYTNSPLVTYKKISPNKTAPRNHAIDTITIHCMAGNLSVESCGNLFSQSGKQSSSNYGIGSDGRIALYVEEKDRSWCSSNKENDHRAVTIEVANDGGENTGWHVSDKAMSALIELIADICKRNGIKKLVWSTEKNDRINRKNGCNITVHRDFSNKSCPGDYLYGKHGYIADEVNKRIGSAQNTPEKPSEPQELPKAPFKVKVIVSDLNYRSEPSMNGKVMGQTGKGVFTIVETRNGWGKLKSGAGWIYLENPKYCTILK